ncbi:MAG: hypothetical protein J2P29_00900 [Actinobacteria bacterium]|nr:hypothetical protein [Actinomycetota bacterium]
MLDGHRRGYRTARTERGGAIPPNAMGAILEGYRTEGERALAELHAVK